MDPFPGTLLTPGGCGVPLIMDTAAHFECSSELHYGGGDHVILLGCVVNCRYAQAKPLVFHRGRYASLDESEGL